MIRLWVVGLLLAGVSSRPVAWAQSAADASSAKFFRLDFENDVLQLRQKDLTDRYFTNGVRVTLMGNFWKRLPTSALLLKFRDNADALYTFSVGQEIYTPADISVPGIITTDRPYAGWLSVSNGLITIDTAHSQKLTSSFHLGVMGPLSLAAEVQGFVHRVGHFQEPRGWGNQVANDIGISYYAAYERRFAEPFHKRFDLFGCVEGHFGTVTNFIGAGGTLRIGAFNDYFQNATGLYDPNAYVDADRNQKLYNPADLSVRRQRTANPASIIANKSNTKGQFYGYIRPMIRAVLDNSFLQGGWLGSRRSAYTLSADEITRFYVNLEFGLVVSFGKTQVSYSQSFRTKEFEGGIGQQWGRISLITGFR